MLWPTPNQKLYRWLQQTIHLNWQTILIWTEQQVLLFKDLPWLNITNDYNSSPLIYSHAIQGMRFQIWGENDHYEQELMMAVMNIGIEMSIFEIDIDQGSRWEKSGRYEYAFWWPLWTRWPYEHNKIWWSGWAWQTRWAK